MRGNSLVLMITAVIIAIAVLLLLNLSHSFSPSTAKKQNFISLNDIRGMAVVHAQKPYTLNFEQQNNIADYFNSAVFVKKSDYPAPDKNLNFEKIIIYKFNAPDIEIKPIRFTESNFVFEAPAWSQESYLMGLSGGALKKLINNSFDP